MDSFKAASSYPLDRVSIAGKASRAKCGGRQERTLLGCAPIERIRRISAGVLSPSVKAAANRLAPKFPPSLETMPPARPISLSDIPHRVFHLRKQSPPVDIDVVKLSQN